MTTEQAAKTLGIGQNAILDAIKRGTLKAEKVGRVWDISDEEVERYRVEHRGKQGRVPPEKAIARARRGAETRRSRTQEVQGLETLAQTLLERFSQLEAQARAGQLPQPERPVSEQDAVPALTVPLLPRSVPPGADTPSGDIAAHGLALLVRRAEAVAQRLEAVATRLEVTIS